MTLENRAKKDIIYADLSGKIIGILLDVYNQLGYGHPEKTYQKAIVLALKEAQIQFSGQLYVPVIYGDRVVGKNFFDFLIDGKVVLEIKKGNYFVKSHIDQVYKYLVAKNLQLGILAYFAPRTVHLKRVVNLKGPYIRKSP